MSDSKIPHLQLAHRLFKVAEEVYKLLNHESIKREVITTPLLVCLVVHPVYTNDSWVNGTLLTFALLVLNKGLSLIKKSSSLSLCAYIFPCLVAFEIGTPTSVHWICRWKCWFFFYFLFVQQCLFHCCMRIHWKFILL